MTFNNDMLVRKILFYLTHDQIENLYQKFPKHQAVKWAFDHLIKHQNDFPDACYKGNWFGIIKFFQKNSSWYDLNAGLSQACLGGHRDIIYLLIRHGNEKNNLYWHWDWGLGRACYGGHFEIALMMIQKGANLNTHGDFCLHYACQGGNYDLVKYLIRQGADNWNFGLHGACSGGHLNLANLMIRKGATDWERGLENACAAGHLDLVHLMIRLGGKSSINKSISNLLGTYDKLRRSGVDHPKINQAVDAFRQYNFELWNNCLGSACKSHHQPVIDLMIQYGAFKCQCGNSIEDHYSE